MLLLVEAARGALMKKLCALIPDSETLLAMPQAELAG